MMWIYSALLVVALMVSSPWWVTRMLTTERYREGLRERLGQVPQRLREAVGPLRRSAPKVLWVHARKRG